MKVRRAEGCACACVRACSRSNTYTRGHNSRDGGESIAAEEEGPGLIVFLRINIINVIQQSVLDEGATTPLRKNPAALP